MGLFKLKLNDTRPILDVVLHDPAPAGSPVGTLGPVHDLTGSIGWNLLLWMSDDTKLIRPMIIQGDPTLGTLRYTWVAGDWAPGSGGPPFTAGGLFASHSLPLAPEQLEHRMEFEVIGPGAERLTFPNAGYDTLIITTDIGQG